MYYLYKIYSLETKHYYIGITQDIKQRKAAHYRMIRDIVYHLRNKRSPMPSRYSYIHLLIANQVLLKVDNVIWPKTIMQSYYGFSIIDKSETIEAATELENKTFCKNKGDKFLTNQQKNSNYCAHLKRK